LMGRSERCFSPQRRRDAEEVTKGFDPQRLFGEKYLKIAAKDAAAHARRSEAEPIVQLHNKSLDNRITAD